MVLGVEVEVALLDEALAAAGERTDVGAFAGVFSFVDSKGAGAGEFAVAVRAVIRSTSSSEQKLTSRRCGCDCGRSDGPLWQRSDCKWRSDRGDWLCGCADARAGWLFR
jgi:hypothetical protein